MLINSKWSIFAKTLHSCISPMLLFIVTGNGEASVSSTIRNEILLLWKDKLILCPHRYCGRCCQICVSQHLMPNTLQWTVSFISDSFHCVCVIDCVVSFRRKITYDWSSWHCVMICVVFWAGLPVVLLSAFHTVLEPVTLRVLTLYFRWVIIVTHEDARQK